MVEEQLQRLQQEEQEKLQLQELLRDKQNDLQAQTQVLLHNQDTIKVRADKPGAPIVGCSSCILTNSLFLKTWTPILNVND